jgi:Holliday junction resolvase RusA-like endonuclease
MTPRNILFVLSSLVLIWSGVGAVMRLTANHVSSPEKVQALMANSPWLDGKYVSDAERKKHLDEIIANVNRLDFEQRRSMHDNDREGGQRFFESLTKEERSHFVKETVEHHFKNVMKAFNQMSREERQKVVKQALNDMKKNNSDDQNMQRLKKDDEQVFETVVEKGMSAYYEDASTETKLDLEPLMEAMQQRIRGMPGR